MKNQTLLISILSLAIVFSVIFLVKNINNKASSPAEVVFTFYSQWINYEGNAINDKFYQNNIFLDSNFSKKLDKLIPSFNHSSSYDPILCGHIAPDRFEIENSTIKSNLATITAKLFLDDKQQKMDVLLLNKKGAWQISDIVCYANSDAISKEVKENADSVFNEIGNIVKNGSNWDLVYEKPGAPALRQTLIFTTESRCLDENLDNDCLPNYWQNGDRVEIKGTIVSGGIKVLSLKVIGENSQIISNIDSICSNGKRSVL